MMEKVIQTNPDNDLKYFSGIEEPVKKSEKDNKDGTTMAESTDDTVPLQYFTE